MNPKKELLLYCCSRLGPELLGVRAWGVKRVQVLGGRFRDAWRFVLGF